MKLVITQQMRKKLRSDPMVGPSDFSDPVQKDAFYARMGWLSIALEIIEDDLRDAFADKKEEQSVQALAEYKESLREMHSLALAYVRLRGSMSDESDNLAIKRAYMLIAAE